MKTLQDIRRDLRSIPAATWKHPRALQPVTTRNSVDYIEDQLCDAEFDQAVRVLYEIHHYADLSEEDQRLVLGLAARIADLALSG